MGQGQILPPDTSICYGGTIQFNILTANQCEWFPAHLFNNQSIKNPICTPNYSTKIGVKYKDQTGEHFQYVNIHVKNVEQKLYCTNQEVQTFSGTSFIHRKTLLTQDKSVMIIGYSNDGSYIAKLNKNLQLQWLKKVQTESFLGITECLDG